MFGKILTVSAVLACAAFAQHPIITTKYTADPAPYVHGDTVHDVRLAFVLLHRHGQLDGSRLGRLSRRFQVVQFQQRRMGGTGHRARRQVVHVLPHSRSRNFGARIG